MVGIVDYGMGNIHSVSKAVESLGERVCISAQAGQLGDCHKLILPGVGAFDDAMLALRNAGLVALLQSYIRSNKPFLGICLGMQLLFDTSEEAHNERGLGIVPGAVKRFSEKQSGKVPHMGWNQVGMRASQCPLFKDVADNSFVYFCHSFYASPANDALVAGATQYGVSFASIVWQEKLFGVQFHPEKSQQVGMRMLKNFIAL